MRGLPRCQVVIVSPKVTMSSSSNSTIHATSTSMVPQHRASLANPQSASSAGYGAVARSFVSQQTSLSEGAVARIPNYEVVPERGHWPKNYEQESFSRSPGPHQVHGAPNPLPFLVKYSEKSLEEGNMFNYTSRVCFGSYCLITRLYKACLKSNICSKRVTGVR